MLKSFQGDTEEDPWESTSHGPKEPGFIYSEEGWCNVSPQKGSRGPEGLAPDHWEHLPEILTHHLDGSRFVYCFLKVKIIQRTNIFVFRLLRSLGKPYCNYERQHVHQEGYTANSYF